MIYLHCFLSPSYSNNRTTQIISSMILHYNYNLSLFDIIIGRNIGGISSTSISLSILSFIILSFSIYYKKYIPIIINIIYFIFAFIYSLLINDYSLLLNSSVIFGSVFVSALPLYSSYSLKGIIIYSFSIGLLTFIISIFNSYISIYIATFIISIFHEKLDNLLLKKPR